ncbi:acetate--CoA ligase family protein [Embleya scabrispora]|uniref:acetate--CoA ligase family protein n=1 Tax=Embleya scabrispora TaxID=159449 RepID=UPI0003AABBDF|nr:acetate--CoA ligase family protein [Embleya scabrispora]
MTNVPTVLSEWESKKLLGSALPTPREALTTSVEEAVALATSIGRPVVAKASSVAHKSDAGLVRIGLSPDELQQCWSQLAEAGDGTVLVAERLHGELELIIGGSRDTSFGPLITVGLGGVAAEVFDDVAVLLSPPEPGELDAALRRLRSAALLEGFRGTPAVDRTALTHIVGLVAQRLDQDPDVMEIDCNPVLVCEGRLVVLDALVVKR